VKTRVSLACGGSRYDNIVQALEPVARRVGFEQSSQVLVKPNFVSTRHQLAATHVDAMHAVLDFVRQHYGGQIVVAEGAALTSTWQGFARFGYKELSKRYDVSLMDLNADQAVAVQVYDRRLKPKVVRLARTVVESDLRISVGPPKVHDVVIVTLSFKNMIMGSLINPAVATRDKGRQSAPASRVSTMMQSIVSDSWLLQRLIGRLSPAVRSDKQMMHQGYAVMHLNLAMLAPWVQPHLAVIDGFQGMEAAGPVHGEPVDWRVALAGTDALAVDSVTARLMGFDPKQVGYLHYCQKLGLGTSDLGQIELVGGIPLDAVQCQFRAHPTYDQQCGWHLEGVDRWLEPALPIQWPQTRSGQEE
jgi:uncharacterized protein (DUF362 family)